MRFFFNDWFSLISSSTLLFTRQLSQELAFVYPEPKSQLSISFLSTKSSSFELFWLLNLRKINKTSHRLKRVADPSSSSESSSSIFTYPWFLEVSFYSFSKEASWMTWLSRLFELSELRESVYVCEYSSLPKGELIGL